MNGQFWNWLKETANRFFQKSPKYFRIWQRIAITAGAISGLPLALGEIPGVHLPTWALSGWNYIGLLCSAIVFVNSKLTVDTPVVAVTDSGTQLKATDETKLPFTASAEAKTLL